jgi:hypothetical protein
MSMNPRLLRPLASGFSPRQVAGLTIWLDALDSSTYTESSGQITEWRSKSGSIKFEQATANNRPTLFESSSDVQGATQAVINNRQAFYFDGTNDQLVDSATIGDRQWTAFAACRTDNTAATQGVFSRDPSSSAGPASNRGPQFLRHSSAGVMQSLAFTDSTAPIATAGTLTSGVAAVINAVQTDSTLQAFLNGVGGTAVSATQNSSATTPRVGGVLPTAEFWKGTVGEILLYNRALTTAERQKVEGYLAWKWGLQGSLPTNHPYAYSFPGFGSQPQPSNADSVDWINRVYSNGGTVSTSTANAVDAFCNAIDAAGLRDRFYRLNLFAGTGLNACLVPLYRGQSRTGTQYGNTTDTNKGPFVTDDYAENDGLLGAASPAKYLETGISPDDVGAATGHVAIASKGDATSATALAIGANNSGSTERYNLLSANANAFQGNAVTDFMAQSRWGTTSGTVYTTAGSAVRPSGLYIFTRTSSTRTDFYLAGVSVANSTASVTPGANANEFYVMAQNINGSPNFTGITRARGYSIGASLSGAQAAAYDAAWTALQTALGRT